LKARVKRWFFAGLGSLFFGLGIVGAFLPVLPTTPFILLALWAFSNSSERLHDYVYHHPKYGALARDWKEKGVIPLKAKISAVSVMALSAGSLFLISSIPFHALVAALAFIAFGAVYILTRPSS
jgi:uncharacterized membrane protein YbaN (DUF454 family)